MNYRELQDSLRISLQLPDGEAQTLQLELLEPRRHELCWKEKVCIQIIFPPALEKMKRKNKNVNLSMFLFFCFMAKH